MSDRPQVTEEQHDDLFKDYQDLFTENTALKKEVGELNNRNKHTESLLAMSKKMVGEVYATSSDTIDDLQSQLTAKEEAYSSMAEEAKTWKANYYKASEDLSTQTETLKAVREKVGLVIERIEKMSVGDPLDAELITLQSCKALLDSSLGGGE